MSGSSTKPYLIRAIHEWCSDQGHTPYLAVAVDEHTIVPTEYVKAGEIVLNVSLAATNRLRLGNDWIEFQARFGGVARDISIPVSNVSAIYARETGHGMAFEVNKAPAHIAAIRPAPDRPALPSPVPPTRSAHNAQGAAVSLASSQPNTRKKDGGFKDSGAGEGRESVRKMRSISSRRAGAKTGATSTDSGNQVDHMPKALVEPMIENPENGDSSSAKPLLSAVPPDDPNIRDGDPPQNGPSESRPRTSSRANARARPKLTRVK